MSTLLASGQPMGLPAVGEALASVVVTVMIWIGVLVLVGAFIAERRATGEPSFVSRSAARLSRRLGRPLWEPMPLLVILGGLAVALVGWRSLTSGGPLRSYASVIAVLGIATALVGGVIATALAHPPLALVERLDQAPAPAGRDDAVIAHPVPAHRTVTRRGRLGSGPIGAALVVAGGAVALLVAPIATVVRMLTGSVDAGPSWPHRIVLAAVGLMCLGAWALQAEGRQASSRGGAVPAPRASSPSPSSPSPSSPSPSPSSRPAARIGRAVDLAAAAGAAAVLLFLSASVDVGLPLAVAGTAGALTLVIARVRATAGVAVVAALGYAVVRSVIAVVTLSSGLPVAPLAGLAVLVALVVEAAVAVLFMRTRSAGPASGAGSGPGTARVRTAGCSHG